MPKLSRRSMRYLRNFFRSQPDPDEAQWAQIVQEIQQLNELPPDQCESKARAHFERARRLKSRRSGNGKTLSRSEIEDIEIAKRVRQFPSLTAKHCVALAEYVHSGRSSAQLDKAPELDRWRRLHHPSMDLHDALAFVAVFRKLQRRLAWVFPLEDTSTSNATVDEVSNSPAPQLISSRRVHGLATPVTSSSQASSPSPAFAFAPLPPSMPSIPDLPIPRDAQEFDAFLAPHMALIERLLAKMTNADSDILPPSLSRRHGAVTAS